ncbi:MAG: PA0069 family radical SAM protein [Betaproteobacteria bacterium]|nr:PA0069 family radical SAM protein [Betaproteobacteria bacterium]
MHKLRGALSQIQGRFETAARSPFDDGWTADEQTQSAIQTTVTEERARSIIARNESPDVPFEQSINPYRGCEHGCIYCLAGETKILMADGTTRPLAELREGDQIYGTRRDGWYRRYVRSRVLAHWSVIKQAFRVTLEDGTTLVAGGDHRFLTERGWKHVVDNIETTGRNRAHLTTNNKLMGTGAFADAAAKDRNYQLGYLCGMIRGDALLRSYRYARAGRANGDQHRFRLALCDEKALCRTEAYLRDWQIHTRWFVFQQAAAGRRAMPAIRTSARMDLAEIRELIDWPRTPADEWAGGFLAGIFDAEGSFSHGVLRISNTDPEIVRWIGLCLERFGFRYRVEHTKLDQKRPVDVVRLLGGLREQLRFFHIADPAITRKRDIEGRAVKSEARLRVRKLEPLGRSMRLYDLTTETEDFIANGIVSHNCYARPSHAYLELSPGLDFETKLFAKTNAVELLKQELSQPGYQVKPIAFGANTDCYQPIERRYQLMRGLLEVLAAREHPLTVVTKSALIERDLDLLAPMAKKNLVKAFISITTLDAPLARRLEPRAASPGRRVDAIRALAAAGIPTGVLVAPVIPALTDKSMEEVLEAGAQAGARMAGWILLRLPNEVRPLFKEWLAAHYPQRADHVISIVRQSRGGRENDPNFGSRMSGTGKFAELIGRRFEVACKRLGLNREDDHMASRGGLDCARFVPPSSGGQLKLF